MFKKLVILSVLLFSPLRVFGLFGEDLGLDMYKKIDEGFYEFEQQQYEYELRGQGRTSVSETITPLLEEVGVYCDIQSTQDIEVMLGNTEGSPVLAIFEACSVDGQPVPNILIEAVINELAYIKNTYSERAEQKVLQSFELSQIGIYSDGSLENSPFDLMHDLEEIDRVLFSEDVEYTDVPTTQNTSNALTDFLTTDKSLAVSIDFPTNEENTPEESISDSEKKQETVTSTVPDPVQAEFFENIQGHKYVCAPEESTNGLGTDSLNTILSKVGNLQRYNNKSFLDTRQNASSADVDDSEIPIINNYAPVLSGTNYTPVTDEWGCEGFFCITVGTRNSNYGTQGSNPLSLQSIFSKVAEHLEKPANASLTQRKMATNNFEISSIITDLPGMLRGLGIQLQSVPVPILELEDDSNAEGSPYATEQMLEEYYKNAGLNYKRQNDLYIFEQKAFETKVLQTSGGMSIRYPESRLNELKEFQSAMSQNNEVFSQTIRKKVFQDDTEAFIQQFSELEGFTTSLEDFAVSIGAFLDAMKKIPTRSS